MKKAIAVFLSVTMLLSAAACSSNIKGSDSASSEIVQTVEPIELVNKMTETELSMVNKHVLTLLDEPVDTEHKVSIEYKTQTPDDMRADLESRRDELTDEQYEQAVEGINKMAEFGKTLLIPYMH